MNESEFRALAAQGYNRIPLVLETFADLDTPLSLYVKLANEPYTFLLESVVGGERFGRYSFIGLPARKRIRARGTAIEVDDNGTIVERHEGDPLAFIALVPAPLPRGAGAGICRASAAVLPECSATTRCATSSGGSRQRRRRQRLRSRRFPTSCSC